MAVNDPIPSAALVIILGASEWPRSPDFKKSEAFANSARELRDYFLDQAKFGLPKENLLDLFDSPWSADDIDEKIGQFLQDRITALNESGEQARDLLVYYVGHGGFIHGHGEFFLAIHRTRSDNQAASSIIVNSLSSTLKEKARHLRRFLILDCCFAASAYAAFQSGPTQAAIKQTFEAFYEPGKGAGTPDRGTALLCSSRHNKPSLLSPDEKYTMFSEALLKTLNRGIPNQQERISLRTISNLAGDYLRATYGNQAPRPEVHSPDQSEGDVAFVPIFPNPALKRQEEEKRLLEEAEASRRKQEEEAILMESRRLIAEGNAPAAINNLQSLLERNPAQTDAKDQLEIARAQLKRLEEEEETRLKRAAQEEVERQAQARRTREETERLLEEAEKAIKERAWFRAKKRLEAVKAVDPFNVEAATKLAEVGRLQRADEEKRERQNSERAVQEAHGEETAYNSESIHPHKQGHQLKIYEARWFAKHDSGYGAVAFRPDGRSALSFRRDGVIESWDVESGRELRRLKVSKVSKEAWVMRGAFSSDGRYALYLNFDIKTLRTLHLFDVESGRELRSFQLSGLGVVKNCVVSVAFSPDSRLVAVGDRRGTLHLFDVESGRELRSFQLSGLGVGLNAIESVTFSPNGRLVAAGGGNMSVKLWDVESGRELRQFESLWNVVVDLAFSPDGRRLLAGCWKRTIYIKNLEDLDLPESQEVGGLQLWDVESGRELQHFEGGHIRSIAFSPDGRRILAADNSRAMRLWDVENWRELCHVKTSTNFFEVTFSPNGYYALSGNDRAILLWRLPE